MTLTSHYYYYPVMKHISRLIFSVFAIFITTASLSAQIDLDIKELMSQSRLAAIDKFLVREESRQLLEQNAKIIDMSSYVMTPGDVYMLTIASGINFDSTKLSKIDYPMILSSDYMLNVPVINEINVKGKSIKEVERFIDKKLQEKNVVYQFLTLQLKVPAQFDVVVHGEVNLPGIKPCTPELTLTDILTLSGGISPKGTYRRIAVTRDGETSYYDISAFFFKGDMSQNPKMQPNDKVYVEPARTNVVIFGQIQNPGIYELIPGENFPALLEASGNFVEETNSDHFEVSRTKPTGEDSLIRVDIADAESFIPINMDKIYVPAKNATQNSIIIEGAILQGKDSPKSPIKTDKINVLQYNSGMTLLTALVKVGGPTPFARMDNCIIQRRNPEEIIKVDLNSLWANRETDQDVALLPGDYVYIATDDVIRPILIAGAVNKPGAINFMPGLTVGEYILYSGGIDIETGNPKKIYFFDAYGNKEKTKIDAEVFPGQNIFVDKNPIDRANDYMNKFFIITGWIAVLTTLTSNIVDIVVTLKSGSTK